MTNEEAAKCIERIRSYMSDEYFSDADFKAMDMAIEALQSAPSTSMSNLIDRQAAIQTALEFIVEYLGGAFDEDFQKMLMERMNALPSAQPEPDWGYSEETKQITLIVPEDVYDSVETIFLSVGYEGTFGIRGMVYFAQPSSSCVHKNDTISRQAAIDAVVGCTHCKTEDELREYVTKRSLWTRRTGGIVDALDAVERLPSAQPDNQVNLCDSCDYSYPDCPSKNDDVIFGSGIGNDNICACNKYKPSAQPRRTGHWISVFDEDDDKCSECQATFFCALTRFNFCPSCGADMRESEGREE